MCRYEKLPGIIRCNKYNKQMYIGKNEMQKLDSVG